MHLLSVFSLRNRALIALLTIVVALFGGVALTLLKQELIPSISLPNIVIVSSYPGASPAVVEHDVSTPIENAIQGVEGLDTTSATSSSGSSSVQASFVYGTNLTTAEQKVQLAIDRIQQTLPDGVTPNVIAGSLDDLPVIQLAVTSDLDANELSAKLQKQTVVELQKIPGVRDASVAGASGQRVQITPNKHKLKDDHLTVQNITTALQQNGILLASGTITEGDDTLVVQSGTRIESVDAIADLPLIPAAVQKTTVSPFGIPTTTVSQPPVKHLHDVAKVELVSNPVTGYSRVNGVDALTLAITKTPAGNTVDVSKAINAQLGTLAAELGSNTKFTIVFDQAPFIETSIDSLAEEGGLGLLFAVVIIFIFLFSIRSTIVAAISIPISVLITFIGMLAFGYSLNILTLGALTIAIGRVVDDSIVVIENIKRHLGLGEDKLTAIRTAVREVAVAVTASTVTTVAVFVPIAFVGDTTGELFRPFALTITIALLSSLFVALTIVPVLAYWFLKAKPGVAAVTHEDELAKPTLLQRAYLPVIRGTVKQPWITLGAAVIVLGLTAWSALGLTTNFIGSAGQNTMSVTEKLSPGLSLDAQDAAARKVEQALVDTPGITTVQTTVGSSSGGLLSLFRGGSRNVSFSVTTDESYDQEALQQTVHDKLATLQDVGEVTISGGNSFGSSDIEVDIKASTADDLTTATQQVLDAVKGLDVTQQAESNLSTTEPYLSVTVNRVKAAKKGMTEYQVGQAVTAAMNPNSAGQVVIGDQTLDIYLKDTAEPTTVKQLENFKITTPSGKTIHLKDVAKVEQLDGPASLATERGLDSSTVTITPKGSDVGTASSTIQKTIDGLRLPTGVTAELGGVTSDQNTAFQQLGLALLAAILIVYTVMVATFRSLRQPLLLLVSIPFAATGAILLQRASGIPLGVPSLVGVLMLIGIVVTNAIVLVDLVNQYRARGMTVADAVVHGAARRLRPILMTALATIFALIPMAIGLTGKSGFISQPLAIIVIGGLVSSTVLTLVVLPTLYSLVEGRVERWLAKAPAKREKILAKAGGADSESDPRVAKRLARFDAKVARREEHVASVATDKPVDESSVVTA